MESIKTNDKQLEGEVESGMNYTQVSQVNEVYAYDSSKLLIRMKKENYESP
ncbi:hypothetical protein [Lentibacillus sp.]|uniref:hypothetical protein n=1 Tax=Lentibacillus sp. TaxID=1925746 RepID=UPI002B4AE5CB|nr:hypothetical protein [Lentibacillus sp.]HLS09083.1 hypothetical protein [Lentibacillus sp.]